MSLVIQTENLPVAVIFPAMLLALPLRREVRSYRQLPLMLYQFGTKFRDEIRPRFGVMRAREFYMKDAYSFHTDEKDLEKYYIEARDAYKKICDRCGFKYRAVEASSGLIGGSFSHEFMVLADTGEEEIVWCDCGYGANINKAECKKEETKSSEKPEKLNEVQTPGKLSVKDVSEFLKADAKKFIKSMIYEVDGKPVMVLVRGDYDINETKVMSALDAQDIRLASAELVKSVSGAETGFAGPVNLKKKIKIIADLSVENLVNAVSGANKTDCHFMNINIGRDFTPDLIADLRLVKRGDKCLCCGKEFEFSRGIEVGHIFKLGLKYSKAMKATYLDDKGKENLMVMGCYGIGVSRIVAATIEQSNDENGIIWPVQIAPYKVVIVAVNWADEQTRKVAEDLYAKLNSAGIETLLDDRDERAGIKFKDADLIGIPYRITVGERNLKENKVEFKSRTQKNADAKLVPLENIVAEVKNLLKIN